MKINLLENRIGKYGKEDPADISEKNVFYKVWDKGKYIIPMSILTLGIAAASADDLGNPKAQARGQFISNSTPASAEPIKVAQNKNGVKVYIGDFYQNNIKYPYGKSDQTRDICNTAKLEIEKGFQKYFMLVSRPELADVLVSGTCVVGINKDEWIATIKLKYEFNANGEILHSNLEHWFSVEMIDPATIVNDPGTYKAGGNHWDKKAAQYADELNGLLNGTK